MRAFPDHFHLHELGGPEGRRYSEPADAFQQLVAQWLVERFGIPSVHVSPTRGRDGSIDIWIGRLDEDKERLLGVPTPAIVECKAHGDDAKDLGDSLNAGWRGVRERLCTQAEDGWKGDFTPWRSARGYVYCVSAVLRTAALRESLGNKITKFFAGLLPEGGVSVESVRLLGWQDLREEFRAVPRLADRWLGVGVPALLGHDEHLAGLSGFRELLLPARLPFVAPEASSPVHPDRLWERVRESAGQRGVFVVGPGGVGKTRTLLEVAGRAAAAGWRVLHVQPVEPALEDEALEETVLAGCESTLLLIDYLDQSRLDLERIRQRLFPAARARDFELAILANARPGLLAREDSLGALFDRVELKPAARQSAAIVAEMVEAVAPKAVSRLGIDSVTSLCGGRPIIALFIAREIERREVAGLLEQADLSSIRPGELTQWLRKRLKEDNLVVPQAASRLVPAEPQRELLAAATMLAAAPLRSPALRAAASVALLTGGEQDQQRREELAEYLFFLLVELGWLEARGEEWAVAHDVVADEVLLDVLSSRPAGTLRHRALATLLQPAKSSARVLGRLAVALRRLIGAEDSPEAFAGLLAERADGWLREASPELGAQFLSGDPDEVSFALGSVLEGPPWSATAFRHWNDLVDPWVSANAERHEARHLLYRGLRALPTGQAALLAPSAVRWLARWRRPEASYVLSPLVGRSDLAPQERQAGVAGALVWLRDFGSTIEAQFVLHPLLGRSDLDPEQKQQAVARALAWLEQHGSAIEAQFVLNPLLRRSDLSPEQKQQAVARARAWLEQYGSGKDAQFVLTPLLGRSDLDPERKQQAVTRALAWLEQHGSGEDAQFVLHPLLRRSDLDRKQKQQAVFCALTWLHQHESAEVAGFVLPPLLRRRDLDSVETIAVFEHALAWLAKYPTADDASFILKQMLKGRRVPPAVAGPLVARSIVWLAANVEHPSAEHVASRLLRRRDLPDSLRREASRLGLRWLRAFSATKDRDYLLVGLLWSSSLLASEDRAFIAENAFDWLTTNTGAPRTAESWRTPLLRTATGTPMLATIGAWYRDFDRSQGLGPDSGFDDASGSTE